MRFQTLLAVAILLATAAAIPVSGHNERPAEFPSGDGSVPVYRTSGPRLVVCKEDTPSRIAALPLAIKAENEALFAECMTQGFRHVQAAVDAVTVPGTRILIQPGVYREEPSLAPATGDCVSLENKTLLSYEEHERCPHVQNLVAILGDDPDDGGIACTTERLCNLQVEGTGATPGDVVIDGNFTKLNVVRADRADGVYFRNLLVQKSDFNALYILETDGFVIDQVVGRWNHEYGFLTFTVDHGLYTRCEAYGNGDSGIYPGSASDLHGARPSVEIQYCDSHHNALGYSGTSGNSVYVHDNDFHHNMAGASMDSFFPGHPGLPQDSAWFTRNRIYSNNENYYNYYDGKPGHCHEPLGQRAVEEGVVCPVVPVPIGTGILLAGGNYNLYSENWIWDNWRYGGMQLGVPAALRDEYDPLKAYDTSHFNRWIHNQVGVTPAGQASRNGLDFWWDEEGTGNCWERNVGAPLAPVTSDPAALPACGGTPLFSPPNPVKLAQVAPCATFSAPDNTRPPGCDWMDTPPRPT